MLLGVAGNCELQLMNLLPGSVFDMVLNYSVRRSPRGGQVVLLDGKGQVYRWLSRKQQQQ